MKTLSSGNGRSVSADDLESQAWNWLRLLHSGDARELDAERFRSWVARSPAHQAAYRAAKDRWDAIAAPARALLLRSPEAAGVRAAPERGPHPGRRAFLGAAVGAASAAAVGGVLVRPPLGWWPAIDEWSADARTGAGEQRRLAMAEGVDVVLNTRTSIRHRTSGGQAAGMELITGEIAVDLAAGRGFVVVAGAGRSHADSGRFEVRRLDRDVCVTCVAGAVQVEHPAGRRTVHAGQRVRYAEDSIGGVSGVDLATATAWREGVLVFERTPLPEAIEEINRYRAGHVLLMNDAARERRVSGRFSIAALDLALWQLQESFGLRARALPAGVLVLS